MDGTLAMEQFIILIQIQQQINGYGQDQWQLQLENIDFVNKEYIYDYEKQILKSAFYFLFLLFWFFSFHFFSFVFFLFSFFVFLFFILILSTLKLSNINCFEAHKKITKIISKLYWHLLKLDIIYTLLAIILEEC